MKLKNEPERVWEKDGWELWMKIQNGYVELHIKRPQKDFRIHSGRMGVCLASAPGASGDGSREQKQRDNHQCDESWSHPERSLARVLPNDILPARGVAL
jgi:hypothetical protein